MVFSSGVTIYGASSQICFWKLYFRTELLTLDAPNVVTVLTELQQIPVQCLDKSFKNIGSLFNFYSHFIFFEFYF